LAIFYVTLAAILIGDGLSDLLRPDAAR